MKKSLSVVPWAKSNHYLLIYKFSKNEPQSYHDLDQIIHNHFKNSDLPVLITNFWKLTLPTFFIAFLCINFFKRKIEKLEEFL